MVSETAAKFCPWTPSREYITGHFLFPCFYCCSVGKSFPTPMVYMQHASLLCPPLSPRVCSDSYPLSWCCYLTTSTSTTLFSFCLQSFPASGSFLMSQLFTSGGQNIGASASASVFPMNIQDWFPLALAGLTSLQSERFSRVFSSSTICKHQFFGAFKEFQRTQLSLWPNSHICTWLLEKP